jgi:7-carboxy-7-deazaguanine synthase
MNINEIFYSLQGEGKLTGVPSVFIRISGCPLRCKWCDTKYAWDDESGTDMTYEQIEEKISQFPSKFIVITGGEPMVNAHLPLLLADLSRSQKHITIETAGISFVPNLPVDLMSISPKLSNSVPDDPGLARVHDTTRLNIKVLRQLAKAYPSQFKFVIDTEEDFEEALSIVEQVGGIRHSDVMLMPQARDRDSLIAKSPMIADMCTRSGFTFSQRLHILLWGDIRGK